MSYSADVLRNSPVLYMRLEETSGTAAANAGSAGGNGTISGATLNQTGTNAIVNGGKAFKMNGGANSYVSFALSSAIFSDKTFTVEWWQKGGSNSQDVGEYYGAGAGYGVLVNATGKLQFTFYGGTTSAALTSTTTVTGTVWHHIMATASGNNFKLYIDGVQEASSTTNIGTFAPSATFYAGSPQTTSFTGYLDEVAVYDAALPSTVAASNYYSGSHTSVDAGYTAQVMTSTSLAPNPVVVGGKAINYNATAATGSGLAVMPVVTNRSQNLADIADDDTQDIGFQTNTLVNEMAIKFATASIPTGAPTGRVLLELDVNTATGAPFAATVHRVTANWSEVSGPSIPAYNSTPVASFSVTGTGIVRVDISALWEEWKTNNNYGLVVKAPATKALEVISREGAVAASRTAPSITVEYSFDGTVSVPATVSTASALMVDPAFSNSTSKTVVAAVATGSGLAVDPTVALTRNVSVSADPFTAVAQGPDGGFNSPVTATAAPMTGSALAVDPAVATERNATVQAEPATSSGVLPGVLLDINGLPVNPNLASDPYYQRLVATTDAEDFWYRLDENAGAVIHAQRDSNKDADLFGSYSFSVFGPESRKAVHFTDGYAKRRWSQEAYAGVQGQTPYDDSDTTTFAFEVVLRTTDGNGMLAYGIDRANPAVEAGPVPFFRNSIYLKDGKVSTNWNYANRTDSMFEFSGNTNVADGKWHHIVVSFVDGPESNLNSGLRIYVDGKLDIRRRSAVVPGRWASPDSYFGMPEAWRNETILYPWRKNFVGDVMEVVFRKDNGLTQDQAIDLFYDAMGIVPIRVTPATGAAYMPEPKARGNQKRVLVLYTKWNGAGLFNSTLIGNEVNSPTGIDPNVPDEFDHDIAIGRLFEPSENPWIDLAGFRVIPRSIMREDADPVNGPYRDPVTDLPRLLNLQEDVNLDEIDLIMFRNWPDEGADQNAWAARNYTNQSVEDFLASVKKAVVDGKSLEVTNVNLASRLGLISGAAPIPMLRDRNSDRSLGLDERDLRGAMLNPWDMDKLGNTYLDLHANNWHRVVANIDGLTTVPAEAKYEHISEVYMTYAPGNGVEKLTNRWGYKLSDSQLHIGDEILDPSEFYNRLQTWNQASLNPSTYVWDKKVWAVTPNGLLAGTPLYRFANKMWENNTLVDNPYRDYIGGAVVQSGDTWGGVNVAGKVFMNFAEVPWDAERVGLMTRQLVPENTDLPNPTDWETPQMREWDYSSARVLLISKSAQGSTTDQSVVIIKVKGEDRHVQLKTDANGGTYYGGAGQKLDSKVAGIDIIEKYDTEAVVVPNWFLRGMAWLANQTEVPAGSVTIRPTPISATAEIPNPTVVGQRSVVVAAQAAVATAVMRAPAEAHDPDVIIPVLPFEATARMTGYGKNIAVAPFEATAELVDFFDLIHAGGEQVVVYLHYFDADVYLKEDA